LSDDITELNATVTLRIPEAAYCLVRMRLGYCNIVIAGSKYARGVDVHMCLL